jgi:hypothetical protein
MQYNLILKINQIQKCVNNLSIENDGMMDMNNPVIISKRTIIK